jgi:hypothetical protein
MVWIIDDLTVTGGIGQGGGLHQDRRTQVFLSKKEGGRTAFAPDGTTGEHMDRLVEELGFQHRPGGRWERR